MLTACLDDDRPALDGPRDVKRARLGSRPPTCGRNGGSGVHCAIEPRRGGASKFDPDGPLPDIPESNASKSGRQRAIDLAKRENLTVRQLAQRLGGHSGLAMVGTPVTIADEMEAWLMTEGSDGFTIQFPYLPGGLDDFVNRVVPELQRRGLFRRDYEGRTLRENLELPRPKNRFF